MSTHPPHPFAADLTRRLGRGTAPPDDIRTRVSAVLGPHASAALLAPDSPDGMASVLAMCSSEGWPVLPLGAATWCGHLRRAAAPAAADRPPILLSTARLDRVTEHEPADLVIGVQAGISVKQLAGALSARKQWLPLDPPAEPDATVGAVVSRADSGPLRMAHGTPRDMVLGIEVATGDGRLLRFGGRVVKNVAGYDGVRLVTGSRGTLGVITSLYLRVRGAARADRTLVVGCGAGDDGMRRGADMARAIREATACDALELLSPGLASSVGVDAVWTLLVRIMGGEAAVSDGVERVRLAVGGPLHGASGVGIHEASAATWDWLSRVERSATATVRLSGPVTELADGLAAAIQTAGGSAAADAGATAGESPGWMVAAHAADGVVRMWQSGSARHRPPSPLQIGPGDSWTVRFEGAPESITHARETGSGHAGGDAVAALTARLRSVFDPAGILSSGEML